MLTIKAKIIIYSEILFAVILCAFAYVLYNSIRHNQIVKLDSQLETYVSGFDRVVSSSVICQDFPDTSDILELKNEGPEEIIYRLSDTNGTVILSTIKNKVAFENKNGFFNAVINDKRFRCLQVDLEPQPHKEYNLLAAAPVRNIDSTLQNLVITFSILIPLFLLLSGLISWLIMQIAFKPLRQIITTAQNISANNLNCRLELPRAHDEIYMLGKVFNEMISRIDTAFNSQKQFVADASHEIRTPLAIIRSELEFAQRCNIDPNVRECINMSLTETDALAKLSEELLTLSKFDSGQVTIRANPVNLNDLLADTVKSLENIALKKGMQLILINDTQSIVNGDYYLLKRALMNILDNAIKYSSENSTVSVIAGIENKLALIEVNDCGPGIAAQELDHIFKRFYRSDSTRSIADGYGLGLPISVHIIKLHKGDISVSSEPHKGTTFRIFLPKYVKVVKDSHNHNI